MRIKLSEQYVNEREEICNKIINILKLDEENSFLLCDLDNDVEKQQAIIALKDEIQKYFAVSALSAFKPNLKDNVKRAYFNIIRFVVKQQGYTIEHKEHLIKCDTCIYKRTSIYKIFRK